MLSDPNRKSNHHPDSEKSRSSDAVLRGIRKTAELMGRAENRAPADAPPANAAVPGYGRARLWLGMSAVGTLVTLAALALPLDLTGGIPPAADASTQVVALLGFVLIYAAVQLPFDIFGGFVLPRRYGRLHPPLGRYLLGLARGTAAHSAVLFGAAVALMYAGIYGGVVGTVAAGSLLALAMLRGRVELASAVAPLDLTPSERRAGSTDDRSPVVMADSPDEGFTGAVVGVFRPRFHLIPAQWQQVLGTEELEVAVNRRSAAVKTGSWRRGRLLALLFTIIGLTAAALAVDPAQLGTAAGTIELSLLFTLWSFLGLLTLPTLSRRGVAEVDERQRSDGCSWEAMEKTARALDNLQDGERDRPALIEAIFHPVPALNKRLRGPNAHGRLGFWDAARTAVFLSLAGLGLLGRAVHCNCGRPSLWVFLPAD